MHGVRGGSEAPEKDALAILGREREAENRGALAENHSVAIEAEWARQAGSGDRTKGFEPGRHEVGDLVETAGKDQVARATLQEAHRETDRERGRRARSEHEKRRVEREAEAPRRVSHRSEVVGGLDVGDRRSARQEVESALRDPHISARRAEDEAHALRAPHGALRIELRRAARKRPPQYGGGTFTLEPAPNTSRKRTPEASRHELR